MDPIAFDHNGLVPDDLFFRHGDQINIFKDRYAFILTASQAGEQRQNDQDI
jgi:hypothetical protein